MADIADKLFKDILESYQDEPKDVGADISTEEQKKYMRKYVDCLSIGDKKALGNILITNQKRNALNWCSEGTAINIDILPPPIIERMYLLVKHCVEK